MIVDGVSEDLTNTISVAEVEEAKAVLRLIPIWSTCLVYAIVFAQSSTLFTKQGGTMDRTLLPNFKIPPASLQTFIGISIIIFLPLYDRILVPILRGFTGNPSGITMLQRIGFGIFLSIFAMVAAALVEIKRLKTAREHGLIDKPSTTVPIAVWWLVPQYVIAGLSDVFTIVGLQEFFYDQVPSELRSMGLSLYLSVLGVGSFLSGFLVSVIDKLSSRGGSHSWFDNNLNRAHLDYFYWLIAGLSTLQLCIYLYVSKSYIYNKVNVR